MAEVRPFGAGWSIARLADEFRLDRRTVAKRLRDGGVPPLGRRGTYEVYRLPEAVAALLGPDLAPAGSIDPRDLKPMERRAYYQSENERLRVETTLGVLVTAGEVEADYAALVKTAAQFFDTLPDVLERKAGLTPDQVMTTQEECDLLRQRLYEAITHDRE